MDTTKHRFSEADYRQSEGEHTSLTGLLKELRDEAVLLVRKEVELAKTEAGEKVSKAGRNVGYLAAGAGVAFAGLIVLLLAISAGVYGALAAAGLSHMIAGWLAPLIVGGLVVAIGGGMVMKGINTLQSESMVPERTAKSLEEDKEWIKEKV